MNIKHLFKRENKDGLSLENAVKQIKESEGFAESCGYNTDSLHCKGCIYACRLSMAKCDTGKTTAKFFESIRTE